jgi:hypothetical protein
VTFSDRRDRQFAAASPFADPSSVSRMAGVGRRAVAMMPCRRRRRKVGAVNQAGEAGQARALKAVYAAPSEQAAMETSPGL